MVVVAAAQGGQLGDRRAAELAAPDHQHLVEQPALLQVGEERGDGLVPLGGELAVMGRRGSRDCPTAGWRRSRPG